ncbi:MAG TPA: peptidoglycan editing factor PgeF [Pyrinomonadaceae bacterium]|nr:peptidoglycan editing factor PgeF [Pyrinomonadaceae bacterium]
MPIEMITDDSELLARAGLCWRERDGLRVLTCTPLEREGFANGFSTRTGGCSPVPTPGSLNLAGFDIDDAANIKENRRRLLELFPGDWRLATCWQVHGADVRRIARDTVGALDANVERCDALTTDAPNVLLGVQTADCVPVLLGDARTGACAAVHAGWRGTAASIVVRTLERMRADYGTRAADVRALIGPAANVCCYEVGTEVVEMFRTRFLYADELLVPTREGHARIDLQRANRQQLSDAGVSVGRIHTAPYCTICRDDLFFSYRREKNLYGCTGRLLAVIGRNDEGGT